MKLASFLAALLVLPFLGCSGPNSSLDVSTPSLQVPVIPAPATSCLAQKQNTGGTTTPTADISAAYFQLFKIKFTKKNPTNEMFIATVRITFTIPGASSPTKCEVAGDQLAALSSTWWGTSGHMTLIPGTQALLETDCPLYCGGIPSDAPFSTSALMEIYGYEQPPGDPSNQKAVKSQLYFQITNY